MTQKILLIEDEESLNRGISLKLAREGYEVYSAATLDQADRLFAAKRPELVICDVGLPDGDGFEFCRRLRRQSKVLFLFLTALDTELDIVNGYDAGADDYMTKPFNILEVKARIKTILRRVGASKSDEKPSTVTVRDLTVNFNNRSVSVAGRDVNLTAKEFDLLQLFITNRGKVFSREMLMESIWKYEFLGDLRTVDVHIRRLREKIEKNPAQPMYIFTKWGVGYYFTDKD